MKIFLQKTSGKLVIACAIFLFNCPLLSADPIAGKWMKSTGDVMIDVKVENGNLSGTLLYWKSETGRTVDSNNPDKRLRTRPLKGIPVLWGVVKKGNKWEGGQIYNASDGKSYRVKLTPVSKDEIELRAYVGAKLFGKTTKWKRK